MGHESHTAKGYRSDFDLRVIVNHEKLTDRVEFWSSAEDRLNRELAVTKGLRTPVNFIVHTLGEVNEGLTQVAISSRTSLAMASRSTRATISTYPNRSPRRRPGR